MYFTSRKNRYCCNLDWLQFSVLLSSPDVELVCPENLRIEICQGNNIFKHRALVFNAKGEKWMTILWSPYSKVLNQCLMTVQVSNAFLYLSGFGVRWAWEELQKIVECSFNAVGRFDVCLDWEAEEKRLEFLRHLNSGHYYAQRKSEGSVWWHSLENKVAIKKQFHCFTWGCKSSEIKVKIYHKSREQGMMTDTSQPEKPYIIDEWRQCGMDVTKVWRLEFSFQGAGQLRHDGQPITLDMIADEQWLLKVLLECYHSRFITRINQGRRQGHKNNDQRVYLLDLPFSPAALKWAEPTRGDEPPAASITLLRSLMRQIDNPVVMGVRQTFEDYAGMILNLIRDHQLQGYFVRTWEADPDDYFNTLYEEVGAGVHSSCPDPRRLMD